MVWWVGALRGRRDTGGAVQRMAGRWERGMATLAASASCSVPLYRTATARYGRCLDTRPIATKVVTTGLVSASGAVASDVLQNPRNPHVDLRRAARFALVAGCMTAPICHVWYGILCKHFGAGGLRCALSKVTLDTLIFATPWQLGFLATVYALEAAPFVGSSAPEQLRGEAPTALERTLPIMPEVMASYVKLWVPVQLVNFMFVPVPLQVL